MRVLLAHADFAPASLALANLKGYALAHPALKDTATFRTVKGRVQEDPDAFVERLVAAADEFRPDVVGLSVYIWSRFRMYEATRRLRARFPEALILWGGPDVSDREDSLDLLREHPGVDLIVRDEGEVTFRAVLLHRLGQGPGPSEIPGLSRRDPATGAPVANEGAGVLENLDEIPSMLDSGELDFDEIESLAIETFRGCYMGCNYCYWGGTTRRAYSDERVFSDLGRMLALPKLKSIWFFDSMFGYKKSTAKRLLRFIIDRKRPGQSITFFPNLDFLDDELCELLKEAGIYLETGIQTTNDEAYETLNRSWDRPFLDKKIALLKKHGLASNAQQLILGLPNDDLAGFRNSVDYAFATRPETIFIFPFSVLPATGFWRRREEFGLKYEGEFRIVYETHRFSQEDLLRGGLIMVGAKWYEKFPGLARRLVRLLGVRPADFFEAFGAAFVELAWGLSLRPENFEALRRKLLVQRLSEDDERRLSTDAIRMALAVKFPGHPQGKVDELCRAENFLNAQVVRAEELSPAALAAEREAWLAAPGAAPPGEFTFDAFADWGESEAPGAQIYWARPAEKPRDFFGKDRDFWRVVVGPAELMRRALAPTPV
jgi:radical SAM superfamily enzyme YgiQ (UPF0313 family)